METQKAMRMVLSFLSLPSAQSSSSSQENFVVKREAPSSTFLPVSRLRSPVRFSPLSPNATSPWNNRSPSPGPLSPWQSPVANPLQDDRSFGCIANMVKEVGHVYALTISLANGLLYTGSESQNIRVWKQPNFYESGCLRLGGGSVKAIVTIGYRIFTTHNDHKIRIWRNGKRMGTLPIVKDQLQNSVNTKKFVCVRRHHKALWIKHVDVISSLAVNEEQGLLYSGSWDKTVKVWRMSDWKCVELIHAHPDAVKSVAVGPGTLLFTGSIDCTVKVWSRFKAEHVLTQSLYLQHSVVNEVAVSPDEGIPYAGSADEIVHYWEKDKSSNFMKHAGFVGGHKLPILFLATVSNLVLSGSADKTIRVWRRDVGTLHTSLVVLQGHGGPVKSIVATIDAFDSFACVYSGSLDHSVKVWQIHSDSAGPATNPVLLATWIQQKLGY